MSYITGSNSKCGAQIEASTYGVAPAGAATKLRMTSESLRATYNRLDEGVLLGNKTVPQQEVGSVGVDGGVNTVLNPSFIDWLLYATLGQKTDSADVVYDCETSGKEVVCHETVYTLRDYAYQDSTAGHEAEGAKGYLPSSTIRIDRGTEGFTYTGMTVSSLALEASSQDFVKANISFTGYKENFDASNTYTADSQLGSYKCTKAKLWPASAGSDDILEFSRFTSWDACPISEVYDVENTNLTIDNGIQTVPATYCSGLYANRPTFGQRSVTMNCNVPYSEGFDTFRKAFYSNEDPAMLALMLMFGSKEKISYTPTGLSSDVTEPAHQVFVILPNVSITDSSANVGGDALVDGSFTGTAVSDGTHEPLKIIVRNYEMRDIQNP